MNSRTFCAAIAAPLPSKSIECEQSDPTGFGLVPSSLDWSEVGITPLSKGSAFSTLNSMKAKRCNFVSSIFTGLEWHRVRRSS